MNLLRTPIDRINARIYHAERVLDYYRPRTLLNRAEVIALLRWHAAIAQHDVLDIGVGMGRTIPYVAPLCRYYAAIDYSPVMVQAARHAHPGVAIAHEDMRVLAAFGDAAFDAILAPNNVFDAVDHDDRLKTLAACRRVLRPRGVLMFSSHNLDWRKAGAPPDLVLPCNPLTAMRVLARWLAARRNRARLRAWHGREGEHAFFSDSGHDYTALHYYIGREAEARQLQDCGFTLHEVIDDAGEVLAPDQVNERAPWLFYVARRDD